MKVVPPNFGYVEDNIFRCGSPDPRHYGFLGSLGLRTCILLTDNHDAAFVRWLQECGVRTLCPLTHDSAPPLPAPEAAMTAGDAGAAGSSPTTDGAERDSAVARFLRENLTDRYHSPTTADRAAGAAPAYPAASGHHDLMSVPEPVVVSILHVMLDPQYYPLLVTCAKGRYRTGVVCGCLRKIQNWSLVSTLEEYRRYAGDKSRAENEEFIELFDRDLVSLTLEGGRQPTILYHTH